MRQLGTAYVAQVSLTHAWMYIGTGIRLSVDVGAHKRRAYGANPTLEDEMFKRTFWYDPLYLTPCCR